MKKGHLLFVVVAMLVMYGMGMFAGVVGMSNPVLATTFKCREVVTEEYKVTLKELSHTDNLKVCVDNNLMHDKEAFGMYVMETKTMTLIDNLPSYVDKNYILIHEYVHHLEGLLLEEEGLDFNSLDLPYEVITDLITYRLLEEKLGYTKEYLGDMQMSYLQEDIEDYLVNGDSEVLSYVEAVIAFEMNK